MQDELENFEYEYTKTGVRYSAPDGSHDDCVMSLALATEIHTKSPAGVTGFSIAPSPPKQKQKIYFS
jgi:hypothetical protein